MSVVLNAPHDHARHFEPGHPERPDRVDAVLAGVGDLDLGDDLIVAPARVATRAELLAVHDEAYIDDLGVFCYSGGGDIDPDTYANYSSWTVAQNAAGAGLSVVAEMATREDAVGLIATRPPGHHATRDRAMGFCLLNNIAVCAAALAGAGERVLIVDWDVHHGNGTQEIFWDDPRVLYASIHQWPLYPGSGAAHEVGGEHAPGLTLNVPLPPKATGDVARAAFESLIAPAAQRFEPTWVLVSAGYDAHRADPMADLSWSAGDFAGLARDVAGVAPRTGRVAFFLEGGYDLDALRASAAATLGAVLGVDAGGEAPTSGGPGVDQVARAGSERLA
ncbi:MAG: histone deacetylase family protein, partial [Acidimicrobiales bacterium]